MRRCEGAVRELRESCDGPVNNCEGDVRVDGKVLGRCEGAVRGCERAVRAYSDIKTVDTLRHSPVSCTWRIPK